MQNDYTKSMKEARAGLIANEFPRAVESGYMASAGYYGYAVSYGGAVNKYKAPAAASDITGTGMLRGFLAMTLAIESVVRGSFKNMIQMLAMLGTPASGTFYLKFGNQVTASIAYNANAATVQAALEALANVGAGNVVVAGSAMQFLITFQGALAGQMLPPVKVVNSTIATSGGVLLTPVVNEVIPPADLPAYPTGHTLNVLKKGALWVPVEEDVDVTSTPYIRFAANPDLPNYLPGSLRASADDVSGSPTAAAVSSGVKFLRPAAAGGLVLLSVDL